MNTGWPTTTSFCEIWPVSLKNKFQKNALFHKDSCPPVYKCLSIWTNSCFVHELNNSAFKIHHNETFHPYLIICHFHASSEFLSTPPSAKLTRIICSQVTFSQVNTQKFILQLRKHILMAFSKTFCKLPALSKVDTLYRRMESYFQFQWKHGHGKEPPTCLPWASLVGIIISLYFNCPFNCLYLLLDGRAWTVFWSLLRKCTQHIAGAQNICSWMSFLQKGDREHLNLVSCKGITEPSSLGLGSIFFPTGPNRFQASVS